MWDIFDEMERMQSEMERYFNRRIGTRTMIEGKHDKGTPALYRTPVTNLRETEKSVIAEFELPGASKENIDVNVTENAIEVKSEDKAKTEHKDEKKGTYSYQHSCRSFYRRIPLGQEFDSEKAEATYKDGILKIEVSKKQTEEPKTKRLQIK